METDIQKTRVLKTIEETRLVAIIRLPDLQYAAGLVRALLAGGVNALEFTLTNRDSIDVIQTLKSEIPEFAHGEAVIGAGTVLTMDDLRAVLDAGAQFIVSPTLNPELIKACNEAGVPVMPGAYTPTEIVAAWNYGADIVKVFPARALGPSYIKDVLNALPHLRLMPTGGIDQSNLAAYLASGVAGVGIGGNLIDAKVIAAQDWAAVTQTASSYSQIVRQHTAKG
jgi:2-dehydro-3-deoxyphosphogluconate aldolase / (4S)-4-hydroxy-2-oxoglutarate aldolase